MRDVGLVAGLAACVAFGGMVSTDTTLADEKAAGVPASAPLSPEETVKRATLPDGFTMTVFAAEPDVVQPIAFTIDDRGRLWVVEGLSYPTWITDGKPGRDRVIILEDTDGDGRHDKRTVFLDNGTNLSGIELGFGGVWLTSCPNLIFVPDANGDDKPDGPAKILLDGWDLKARHNVVNGLHWGPDGWLYGLNGILSNSKVGKPGTPDDKRTFMNCGVWRYHPVRHVFEVVAHGTTNPWGMDWDAHGRLFVTNCVIEHVFHIIPGGHYKRMFGQDAMPNSYELLQTCADHIHWGGGRWTDSRGGEGIHDTAGGGHAHVGCMIYQGDNWPEKYRGGLFTCNLHGQRVNHDTIEPKGSGVVVEHGDDFLKIPDPWFRGLEMKYGPDGGVYLTDWCDDGECHDYTEQDINRQNGRIYKITYGTPTYVNPDLRKLGDRELVQFQSHRNEWYVRHSRRIIQERASKNRLNPNAVWNTATSGKYGVNAIHAIRGLWTRNAGGAHQDGAFVHWEHDSHPEFLAAAIAQELDDGVASLAVIAAFVELAKNHPSPIVRLALAAGLQRVPIRHRWEIAEALVAHDEDADDANIPLMLWYGIEPMVAADRERALGLLVKTRIPLVRQLIARRLASP